MNLSCAKSVGMGGGDKLYVWLIGIGGSSWIIRK